MRYPYLPYIYMIYIFLVIDMHVTLSLLLHFLKLEHQAVFIVLMDEKLHFPDWTHRFNSKNELQDAIH